MATCCGRLIYNIIAIGLGVLVLRASHAKSWWPQWCSPIGLSYIGLIGLYVPYTSGDSINEPGHRVRPFCGPDFTICNCIFMSPMPGRRIQCFGSCRIIISGHAEQTD